MKYCGFNNSILWSKSESLTRLFLINSIFNEILAKLERQFSEKNNNFNEYESRTQISAQYGTLIKGGLKTFGCNYGVEIKFDFIKYEVFVDEFTEGNQRKQVKFFERLLHKPLTKTDITKITKQLTDAIYEHIDVNTKKNGLR